MTAARYGRLFRTDPARAVLDRPAEDLPILVALYEAAARDIRNEQRGR